MTREQAIERLREIQKVSAGDPEAAHCEADQVLYELLTALGYSDVLEEWNRVDKWYA